MGVYRTDQNQPEEEEDHQTEQVSALAGLLDVALLRQTADDTLGCHWRADLSG